MIADLWEPQEPLLRRLAAWSGAKSPGLDWLAESDRGFQLRLVFLAQLRTPYICTNLGKSFVT